MLLFVAIGTDTAEDLLRSSILPCNCACIEGEKKVPQDYDAIQHF